MENENLVKQRHSLSHLLAIAVKEYYPHAKLAIGPVIDTGFYYDFDFGNGAKPTDKDLKKLEQRVKELAKQKIDFEKKEVTEKEAKALFMSEPYKLELIEEIVKNNEKLSVYKSGDFTDLCSGPHVLNTSEIDTKAFKLDKTAGAYWRGSEKNQMLTRIYGLYFGDKEKLDEYEKMLIEAEKRDHRKIGVEQDLFTFSDLVGSGLPMFTPKGTAMRDAIVEKIASIQSKLGYKKVCIPHITKKELYEKSGHWEKFGDELFKVKGRESEFVIKPMNCPHHCQIFSSFPKSYRDLPVRYMETTTVYRDEQSGELLGLSRVRSLTQDDGHVFCTQSQIEQEIKNIISVIKEFYSSLGMWDEGKYWVRLSTRDTNAKEKYLGGDEIWDQSEKILEDIAKTEKFNYKIGKGEAAFYGPKLDFMFKDAIGREWQLATIQLDFNMPKRFELEYADKDGTKKTPVMIHRAIAGSLERFLSVIIEHFAGAYPFWLSPLQIKTIPVSEAQTEYAKSVNDALGALNIRAELDDSDKSLGKKISSVKSEKIPYFLVIGDREVSENKITVESRDKGKIGEMTLSEFIDSIKKEM